MAVGQEIRDGFLDLVLGAACVVCGHPGPGLCRTCRDGLPAGAGPRWPTPTPAGLVPPYAVGDYDDALKAMVVAHKERGVLGLGRPLGTLLARAATAAALAAGLPPDAPLLLVPVPSRRAAVRRRGHDATADIARAAARRLRRDGRPAEVAQLLRVRSGVADQAGLDTGQRAANLAGALAVRTGALRRQTRRPPAHVIICDDVITTGASLREAQRALEASGAPVLAAATVAATRRRRTGGAPGPDGGVLRPDLPAGLSSAPATD